jgi:hypothetical protein
LALLYKASVDKYRAAHAILYVCAVHVFVFGRWRGLVELADGLTGRGEVAKGGCLFVCNFSVTRSTLLTEARRH